MKNYDFNKWVINLCKEAEEQFKITSTKRNRNKINQEKHSTKKNIIKREKMTKTIEMNNTITREISTFLKKYGRSSPSNNR